MTATELTLRSAAPTDADALATLLQGIGWFRAYAQNPIEQSREAVRGLLRSAQDDTRSSLWVAESEALGLCGYCAVHWLPVAVLQGWEAYVSELFVADAARGQHVGARLLDTAVQADLAGQQPRAAFVHPGFLQPTRLARAARDGALCAGAAAVNSGAAAPPFTTKSIAIGSYWTRT
jgi:GNAT superfamily N-acetyltransferase